MATSDWWHSISRRAFPGSRMSTTFTTLLQFAAPAFSIDESMIDVQHDSPVPIHEQITSQLMAHIAKGVLKAGARLADHRTFAQKLLANPQVVARAYADLEWAGVLEKHPAGGMEIARGADVICRGRLQDTARQRIREAVRHGVECGLAEADICQAVDQALASPAAPPLTPEELSTSIKKPSHASSHRDSQGIQDLSRQKGPGSP
jgi:DNA-binding transcriptional regulator YhcF (GntR family)